jgi:hypothetical protein
MSKLRLLTLVSMLLLVVAVGCSSSDQVAEPTPLTISTELSNCVTTIAYLAFEHRHNDPGRSDGRHPQLHLSYMHPQPFDMLNHYCGSYIDSQLLEKFSVGQYGVPEVEFSGNKWITGDEVRATQQAIRDR